MSKSQYSTYNYFKLDEKITMMTSTYFSIEFGKKPMLFKKAAKHLVSADGFTKSISIFYTILV